MKMHRVNPRAMYIDEPMLLVIRKKKYFFQVLLLLNQHLSPRDRAAIPSDLATRLSSSLSWIKKSLRHQLASLWATEETTTPSDVAAHSHTSLLRDLLAADVHDIAHVSRIFPLPRACVRLEWSSSSCLSPDAVLQVAAAYGPILRHVHVLLKLPCKNVRVLVFIRTPR